MCRTEIKQFTIKNWRCNTRTYFNKLINNFEESYIKFHEIIIFNRSKKYLIELKQIENNIDTHTYLQVDDTNILWIKQMNDSLIEFVVFYYILGIQTHIKLYGFTDLNDRSINGFISLRETHS